HLGLAVGGVGLGQLAVKLDGVDVAADVHRHPVEGVGMLGLEVGLDARVGIGGEALGGAAVGLVAEDHVAVVAGALGAGNDAVVPLLVVPAVAALVVPVAEPAWVPTWAAAPLRLVPADVARLLAMTVSGTPMPMTVSAVARRIVWALPIPCSSLSVIGVVVEN